MNIVLWVLQVFLGIAFLWSGVPKVIRERGQLLEQAPYVEDLSDAQVTTIGMLEVAGGLGVILPAVTGIVPVLTPIAAVSLAVVMVGAALLHVRRREPQGVAATLVIGALAAVVAWGRFGPYPT
jgi:uncharacterized membrane protein YphA (DoxX/SURF4 family)